MLHYRLGHGDSAGEERVGDAVRPAAAAPALQEARLPHHSGIDGGSDERYRIG